MGKRHLLIVGLLALVIVVIILALVGRPNGKSKAGSGVPSSVTEVAKKYLAAEEDSVGADQTSPTSWLNQVKPITTPDWYKTLQPESSATSSVPAEYYLAHSSGYVVKANVSNCIWTSSPSSASPDSGSVFCSLSDTTVSQSSGQPIAAGSLPFGWTHSGPRSQHILYMIKQGGNWFISKDVVSG